MVSKFKVGDPVKVKDSNKSGIIVGHKESYLPFETRYLVSISPYEIIEYSENNILLDIDRNRENKLNNIL